MKCAMDPLSMTSICLAKLEMHFRFSCINELEFTWDRKWMTGENICQRQHFNLNHAGQYKQNLLHQGKIMDIERAPPTIFCGNIHTTYTACLLVLLAEKSYLYNVCFVHWAPCVFGACMLLVLSSLCPNEGCSRKCKWPIDGTALKATWCEIQSSNIEPKSIKILCRIEIVCIGILRGGKKCFWLRSIYYIFVIK